MTIPSSRSLIFEVKSTRSELAFIRVLRLGLHNFPFSRLLTSSEDFGRLRKSSDFFRRLRTSSGIFGNDRVVFKNPTTPRIKISRLYLRKSWQVYLFAPQNFAQALFSISLGTAVTRKRNKKQRLCKISGAKKVYYGRCARGKLIGKELNS